MENNLNKILEMFNLSYNEEFQLEEWSEKFRFTLDGLEAYDKKYGWRPVHYNVLEGMILGNYKIILGWLPKRDDTYYLPNIDRGVPNVFTTTWRNTYLDDTRYKARMVFKTKDEALVCAEEILEFLAKK